MALGSIRKRGKKWYYSFELATVDGKRKRIERVAGTTKKSAEKALQRALYEMDTTGLFRDASEISFADFLDLWLEQYGINLSFNTKKTYKKNIETHLKPGLGSFKLKHLQPELLQNFINKKKLEGYKKSTVSQIMAVLSMALAYAVHPLQYIKEDPMRYIKMPKYDILIQENIHHKVKTLSGEEIGKIQKEFKDTIYYLPIMIAYLTGIRAGECLALEWSRIDWENNCLKVRETLLDTRKNESRRTGPPKSKASLRDIPFGPTLQHLLKESKLLQAKNQLKYGEFYVKSNNVCIKKNGCPLNHNDLRYLAELCQKKLQINFNFHMLRHTHATLLLESGADMLAISKRLGHKNLATTADIYAHVRDKLQDKTVAMLEQVAQR